MAKASVALVWHAHLPITHWPTEKNGVADRLLDFYISILEQLEVLSDAGHALRLTLALSPTLLACFEQPQYAGHRFRDRILRLHERGVVDLLACAAGNGLLPLMKTEEAVRAQMTVGMQEFRRQFGFEAKGFWLPECAFTVGVDRLLKQIGVEYFFVPAQSILYASPRPNQLIAAPLMSPYGVSAFARHSEIDLFLQFIANQPLMNPHTVKTIDWMAEQADREPIVVNVLNLSELVEHDRTLLAFLEQLATTSEWTDHDVQLSTAADYLQAYPFSDTGILAAGSLSVDGSFEKWLRPGNDWIYRHLHEAEEQVINHANCFKMHKLSKLELRALNQVARELLILQHLDWAELLLVPSHSEAAERMFKERILHIKKLLQMVGFSSISESFVEQAEKRLPVYPAIDFREFASRDLESILREPFLQKAKLGRGGKRILMLAWEFPPLVVGGLSRAVYDLSKYLVAQGHDIHVVTTEVNGAPYYELMDGMHVHRMHVLRTNNPIEFMDWVFQMNTVFTDYVLRLQSLGKTFDVIHAHDWLVYYAARELKYSLKLPLVATIHATEHGRNHGKIYSKTQSRIAELEWNLTYEAAHVIACSHSMENEVKTIFQLPPDKVSMIHNGVDLPHLDDYEPDWSMREKYAYPGEKIIFYIGRLVFEKGIQVLIEAMPAILRSYPNCKLVIAGAGGMKDDLQRRAAYLGHKVLFVGFVDDHTRNFLLKAADVCVFPSLYEPFGIVALEAMYSETPVVVSDVGGLAEIIDHGRDGYKALPGNADSLATHIADLLHHPEKAKAMAKVARQKTIVQYNWKTIAKRTVNVYELAMKRIKTGG